MSDLKKNSALGAAWIWLDMLCFGNGHGMAEPYFDGRFYWLSGKFYKFMRGLGAQLTSYQWRHPPAGEKRFLAGRDFMVLHSRRQWLRVEVAWSMPLPSNLDEAHAVIRALKQELDSGLLFPYPKPEREGGQ